MSVFNAVVEWKRSTPDFAASTYDRSHRLRFDHGIVVPATASPENIPPKRK